MWADRFAGGGQAPSSGSSTPQSTSRPYSPAPKRASSNLGPHATLPLFRAGGGGAVGVDGGGLRPSTLSLVSNESGSSLLATASGRKAVNGSSLKQSTTAAAAADPLEMLGRLLGVSQDEVKTTVLLLRPATAHSITEADLDLDFEFDGHSLRALAESRDVPDREPASARPQTNKECKRLALSLMLP